MRRLAAALAMGGAGALAFAAGARMCEVPPYVGLIPPATTIAYESPVCSLLADGADSPRANDQWATLVSRFGPLDYVGGYSYGSVVTMNGQAVGYALAEDSDIWSDPSCLTFSLPERFGS